MTFQFVPRPPSSLYIDQIKAHLFFGVGLLFASYLERDVIELAAVADGRSAGMDHAVHLNNARAAPHSFPRSAFRGGAARRRAAAGGGFAFGSLLARHRSRFPNYCESRLEQITII